MKEKRSKEKLQKEKMPKKKEKLQKKNEKREHRVSFMLNDKEYNAIERHLHKYKITNKSKWYRHTVLAHVWKVLGEDYPKLFDESEMK